jgi:hypothetical protein
MPDPTSPSIATPSQIELMERMNTLLTQQLETQKGIASILQGQAGITREAAAASEEYARAAGRVTDSNREVESSFLNSNAAFTSFTDGIKSFIGSDAYEKVTSSFSNGVKLLGVNFDSLAQIISNPVAAASGFLMELWSTLARKAAEVYQAMLQLAQSMEKIREKFGSFNENTSRRTLTAFRNLGDTLRTTTANSAQFGRKFAPGFEGAEQRLDVVLGIAEDLSPVIDLLGQQFNDAADNMFLLSKGLNFSGEALKQVAVLSQLNGKSLKGFSEEIMATVNKIGKQFNISTKVLGQDVGKALSNFKLLGRMTGDYVKEMTKAAVFTRKLGIEINELTGLVDKFDEFEGGAEAAAQLAQGFGMVLDPLKMMGMEVGPRLQEMQRAFMATGRSIDSMSRQERKLLADTAGLTEQQALLAFSSKGMAMSYDEIAAGAEGATKQQKTTDQIINDVLDNIPNVIVGFKNAFGFIEAFFEGIGTGFGIKMMPTLIALAERMGKVFGIGIDVGMKFFEIFFPANVDQKTGKTTRPMLDFIVKIGDMFVSIAEHIRTFVNLISPDGKGSIATALPEMLDNIWTTISNTFSFEGMDIGVTIGKMGTKLLEILAGTVEWLVNKIPQWTQSLTEMFTEEISDEGGAVNTAWDTAMERLKTAIPLLLANLPDLAGAFIGAVGRMFEKYPWVSGIAGLFVAGGPIMTMLGGISTGFFSALGNLFGGPGAAAGAAASATEAAKGIAAGNVSEGTGAAVTEGATAVVENSQGLLQRLFDLIEEPAKIGLMATAISSAIVMLGNAVREVFLAFMDPMPERDNKSFVDIVIESANKFQGVSWQNLLSLGAVLGVVGLAVGGLVAGVVALSSKVGTGGALAVAGGTALAGYFLSKSGGTKAGGGMLGNLLGGIGGLIQDIVMPFTNPMFIFGLNMMAALKDKFTSLVTVADSLRLLTTSLAAMRAAMPTTGVPMFKDADTKPLITATDAVFKFLSGDPDAESDFAKNGLILSMYGLPVAGDMTARVNTIASAVEVINAITTLARSIVGIGDAADVTSRVASLVGAGGLFAYIGAIPGWIVGTITTEVPDDASKKIDAMVPAINSINNAVKALNEIEFKSGGLFTTGTIDQASSLIDLMPKMRESINVMSDEMKKISVITAEEATQKSASINGMFTALDTYAERMDFVTDKFTVSKLTAFAERLTATVKHIGKVRQILEDLPTMTLDATIGRMGKDMTVAKKTFEIAGGAVQVNVRLNLTMNAEKLSSALVLGGFVQPTKGYTEALQQDYEDGTFNGLSPKTVTTLGESAVDSFKTTSDQ